MAEQILADECLRKIRNSRNLCESRVLCPWQPTPPVAECPEPAPEQNNCPSAGRSSNQLPQSGSQRLSARGQPPMQMGAQLMQMAPQSMPMAPQSMPMAPQSMPMAYPQGPCIPNFQQMSASYPPPSIQMSPPMQFPGQQCGQAQFPPMPSYQNGQCGQPQIPFQSQCMNQTLQSQTSRMSQSNQNQACGGCRCAAGSNQAISVPQPTGGCRCGTGSNQAISVPQPTGGCNGTGSNQAIPISVPQPTGGCNGIGSSPAISVPQPSGGCNGIGSNPAISVPQPLNGGYCNGNAPIQPVGGCQCKNEANDECASCAALYAPPVQEVNPCGAGPIMKDPSQISQQWTQSMAGARPPSLQQIPQPYPQPMGPCGQMTGDASIPIMRPSQQQQQIPQQWPQSTTIPNCGRSPSQQQIPPQYPQGGSCGPCPQMGGAMSQIPMDFGQQAPSQQYSAPPLPQPQWTPSGADDAQFRMCTEAAYRGDTGGYAQEISVPRFGSRAPLPGPNISPCGQQEAQVPGSMQMSTNQPFKTPSNQGRNSRALSGEMQAPSPCAPPPEAPPKIGSCRPFPPPKAGSMQSNMPAGNQGSCRRNK